VTIAGSLVRTAEGEGFVAPGPSSFDLPPVFSVGGVDVTKPMLLLVVAAVVVFWFFYAASRQRSMVATTSPAINARPARWILTQPGSRCH